MKTKASNLNSSRLLCKVAGASLGLFLACLPAHGAQILINIDGPSKMITASGTITGTTDDFWSPQGGIGWLSFGAPSVVADHSVASLLNVSGPAAPFGFNFAVWGSSGWEFTWDFGGENSVVTIAATGASIDYSGWDPLDIAAIESTIGSVSGGLLFGTSADSFQITGTPSVSAIPEPGSVVAMAALLGFGFLYRSRRGVR